MKTWRLASPVPEGQGADPEGWTTLRVQFDDEEQACFVVRGLGPRVDVIEPSGLRDRIAADAAAVVERARRFDRPGGRVTAGCRRP